MTVYSDEILNITFISEINIAGRKTAISKGWGRAPHIVLMDRVKKAILFLASFPPLMIRMPINIDYTGGFYEIDTC